MAWNFTISATCDKCGVSLVPERMAESVLKITTLEGVKTLRWCVQQHIEREGMLGPANMAGKRKMYCRACAGS